MIARTHHPHRLTRLATALALTITLTTGTIAAQETPVASPDASPASTPLADDLTSRLLHTEDLATASFTPYTAGFTEDLDAAEAAEAANILAEFYQRASDGIAKTLAETSFTAGAFAVNDYAGEPDDPDAGIIASGILTFDAAKDATAVTDALTDWSDVDADVTVADNIAPLGDVTQVVTYANGGGEAPTSTTALLTFRDGATIGFVVIVVAEPGDDLVLHAQVLGKFLHGKIELA